MARLKEPLKDKQDTNWQTIDQEVMDKLKAISGSKGKIVLLSSTIISPSTRKAIEEFKTAFPTTEWIIYDTVSSSAQLDANEAGFGTRALPTYHFDKAALIVAMLFSRKLALRYNMPGLPKGRKLIDENKMSAAYQYESCLSLISTPTPDQMKPSEELIVLLNLYNGLAGEKGIPMVNVISPLDMGPLVKN
jgi:molybdopterin-containing oxidoreductase family iron-sulfur binding subunit